MIDRTEAAVPTSSKVQCGALEEDVGCILDDPLP